ncbi:MAG TPA: hypothetical protein VK085_00400 [Pseudogracilibacillus sp.]|nr:hypothetical protein [Pseudogracilibacillus sp.]
MKKVVIDGFELTEDYKQRLLKELKEDGVKTTADLQAYFSDHWYTKDMSLESHLLLCRHPKKRNFALPFDE